MLNFQLTSWRRPPNFRTTRRKPSRVITARPTAASSRMRTSLCSGSVRFAAFSKILTICGLIFRMSSKFWVFVEVQKTEKEPYLAMTMQTFKIHALSLLRISNALAEHHMLNQISGGGADSGKSREEFLKVRKWPDFVFNRLGFLKWYELHCVMGHFSTHSLFFSFWLLKRDFNACY